MRMCKIKYRIKNILFILLLIAELCGCSNLKSENEIIKFVKNEFGIDATIMSKDENNDYHNYILRDNETNISFSCSSAISSINIDLANFFQHEVTSCDYYNELTNYLSDNFILIKNRYLIDMEYEDGLISKIILNVNSENDVDFYNLKSAVKEIMDVYNLKMIKETSFLSQRRKISTSRAL